jgi:hypothetical protein
MKLEKCDILEKYKKLTDSLLEQDEYGNYVNFDPKMLKVAVNALQEISKLLGHYAPEKFQINEAQHWNLVRDYNKEIFNQKEY